MYTDSSLKWQRTLGSRPTHRHEKPVLFTFLRRLMDCSLTQHTVTVREFPGLRQLRCAPEKSQRRPPCDTMNYASAAAGWEGGGGPAATGPSAPRGHRGSTSLELRQRGGRCWRKPSAEDRREYLDPDIAYNRSTILKTKYILSQTRVTIKQ